MPGLDTSLHVDMLRRHKRQSSFLSRLYRALKSPETSDQLYGLDWGDPEIAPRCNSFAIAISCLMGTGSIWRWRSGRVAGVGPGTCSVFARCIWSITMLNCWQSLRGTSTSPTSSS
jgi:hypothetical protein